MPTGLNHLPGQFASFDIEVRHLRAVLRTLWLASVHKATEAGSNAEPGGVGRLSNCLRHKMSWLQGQKYVCGDQKLNQVYRYTQQPFSACTKGTQKCIALGGCPSMRGLHDHSHGPLIESPVTQVDGQKVNRTWTVSSDPEWIRRYVKIQISVKRAAFVSAWLHDHLHVRSKYLFFSIQSENLKIQSEWIYFPDVGRYTVFT